MPREGLIAVERTVERGGSSHTQRFWVRPEDAKRMVARGQAREVKTLARLKQAKAPAPEVSAEYRARYEQTKREIADDHARANRYALERLAERERLAAVKARERAEPAPEVRSAAVSLLRDAGGLTAAIEAMSSYSMDTVIDPESRADVSANEVRQALEAMKPPPLPAGEEYVTVHHSTSEDRAEQILRDGVIPEAKGYNLVAEQFEQGEAPMATPGRGLSRGLYVGAPDTTSGFGRVTLELKIPRSYIEPSPEAASLGGTDIDDMLKSEQGAVVTKPIPSSAIRRIG